MYPQNSTVMLIQWSSRPFEITNDAYGMTVRKKCAALEILFARCMDGCIAVLVGDHDQGCASMGPVEIARVLLQTGSPSVPCSFCNDNVLETTEHLFLSCPRVHALLHAVLHTACRETKLSVGSKSAQAEDVLQWVYADGKLLRSKHERSC